MRRWLRSQKSRNFPWTTPFVPDTFVFSLFFPETTTALPKRAIELRNRGLKIPEIANALNVSERSVFRYLSQLDTAC